MCSKCGFDDSSICELRNVEIKCNHEASPDSPVSQQRKLHFMPEHFLPKWSAYCTGLEDLAQGWFGWGKGIGTLKSNS